MAVTIPMIVSRTARIQSSPPQEVKSTCDEKQVINRMKVKLFSFKPQGAVEVILMKEDKKKKGHAL